MLPLVLAVSTLFAQPILDDLFDRLPESSQRNIELLGEGFEERVPPKLQIRLLRQDIEWQNRGFSDRQVRLISALALYRAIGNAEEELAPLMHIDGAELSDTQRTRKRELISFIAVATLFVEDEAKALENMKDYELTFLY